MGLTRAQREERLTYQIPAAAKRLLEELGQIGPVTFRGTARTLLVQENGGWRELREADIQKILATYEEFHTWSGDAPYRGFALVGPTTCRRTILVAQRVLFGDWEFARDDDGRLSARGR
ncbi:MAG: hypothetical protein LPK92_06480 [Actinomycetes bacterium]|nr:hypothetical protein [Actinomycetes bacterium]